MIDRRRNWTGQQIKEAQRLHFAGFNHRQIAEQIGKTHNAVAKALLRAGFRQDRSQSAIRREQAKSNTAWTPAEVEILQAAATEQQADDPDARIDWVKVSSLLPGRTSEHCRARWHTVVTISSSYKKLNLGQSSKIDVPAHVIAERDNRLKEYRTPAQIMMGDPSFSQSAWGKKQQS